MTIADEITREVVFSDHACSIDARIEVAVSLHNAKPIANVRMPKYPCIHLATFQDVTEPDLLRSYAACLNAAADEMERMKP